MPLPLVVNTQWEYQVFAVGVEGTLVQTVREVRPREGGWEVVMTTRARIGTETGERFVATERYLVSQKAVLRLTGFGGILDPPLLLWSWGGGPEDKEWKGQLMVNGKRQELSAVISHLGRERVSAQGRPQEAEKIRVVWSGAPFSSEHIYWFVRGMGFVRFQINTPAGRVTAVLRELRISEGSPVRS